MGGEAATELRFSARGLAPKLDASALDMTSSNLQFAYPVPLSNRRVFLYESVDLPPFSQSLLS
jgi:hypothetical protein